MSAAIFSPARRNGVSANHGGMAEGAVFRIIVVMA